MTVLNDYLVNGQRQLISPLDRGFSYGDGVFRTFAICLGHDKLAHIWSINYQKLVADCNVLGIVCPSATILFDDISQLLAVDELSVIKIIITRGEGARGYTPPAVAVPNRVVIKSAMPSFPSQNLTEGVTLRVCDIFLPYQSKLAGIKHLNKLENVLARMELQNSQIADGILLDANGYVIECTSSNIFIRIANTLITPDLSHCGVAGVTRQRIIALSPSLNLAIKVQKIMLDELMQADEVLICNSLIGVWQVTKLQNKTWKMQNTASQLKTLLEA
ncbi:MAG: aminodeoxychorismate lyase [Methylophilaceae bacterium]|nr:aminodeoxychorismate lyase [Methylophilaceae bacterium]